MELTPCSVTQPHRWTSFLSDTATHSLIQKQDWIFIKLHVQGSAVIDHSDGYNRTTKCCASKAACPNLAVPDPVSPQNHLHAAHVGLPVGKGACTSLAANLDSELNGARQKIAWQLQRAAPRPRTRMPSCGWNFLFTSHFLCIFLYQKLSVLCSLSTPHSPQLSLTAPSGRCVLHKSFVQVNPGHPSQNCLNWMKNIRKNHHATPVCVSGLYAQGGTEQTKPGRREGRIIQIHSLLQTSSF